MNIAGDPAILSSELELMLAPDPRNHIVGNGGGTHSDVLGVDAGAAAESVEAVAKVDYWGHVMSSYARNLRHLVHVFCVDATISLIAVEIAEGGMIQYGGTYRVVPVDSVDKCVLRRRKGLTGQLGWQGRKIFR